MTKLKPVYPLYLANEARQPNADLAVTDKYSAKVVEAALGEANDSRFGLQAGLFTRDLFKALDAWDRLEVGGVVINDVPSYRVDNMPYGGVKDSGLGREGVRFAMEDMTEIRNLVIRRGAGAALRDVGS
jgi:acyl-CoA reductase-like NAD-dependent aldehyde dehydrogenase